MNCSKCGAPLMENDKFCKGCGTAVNASNVQNNVGINTQNGFNNTQQPINGYQQPVNNYNNGYMQQPMNIQPAKNNNMKFIFIGLGVAILAAVIILIVVLAGNNKNGETNNNESNALENNNIQTQSVNFKGFTFEVPTNLAYEVGVDVLALTDQEGTWLANVEVMDGAYSQIVAKKAQLKTNLEAQGFVSSIPVEKNINGINFVTLEFEQGGKNGVLGICEASSIKLFGITAYNIDNEYDYSLIENIASVLKNAKYTGETNNMSVSTKIDMNGISALAK